jgi:hypothetical protein
VKRTVKQGSSQVLSSLFIELPPLAIACRWGSGIDHGHLRNAKGVPTQRSWFFPVIPAEARH